VTALLALALELAAGGVLAWRLVGPGSLELRERLLWALALAAPLGAGWASLLYVGHRALGLPVPAAWFFVLETAVAALALGIGRRAAEPVRPGAGLPAPTVPLLLAAAAALTGALLAARAAVAFRLDVPEGAYDAVATWNLRARLLFGAGDDWVAALDATNYPLLLPGAIATAWSWLGGAAPAIPHGVGAALTASCALVLPLALGRRGRALGLAAAALLLTTPTFLVEGFSQEADIPVAALLLAGAAILAGGLGGRPAPPLECAGALLGLAAWTKNEGLLWATLALAAWALAGGWKRWRDLSRLLAGAAPALVA